VKPPASSFQPRGLFGSIRAKKTAEITLFPENPGGSPASIVRLTSRYEVRRRATVLGTVSAQADCGPPRDCGDDEWHDNWRVYRDHRVAPLEVAAVAAPWCALL